MKLELNTLCIALALTACGSGPISMDGGSDETGDESDDADTGDTDGPAGLACADENGLVPGVLRLEPSEGRAWLIENGAEIELDVAGDQQADWMIGAAAGERIAVARIDGQWDDQDSIVQAFTRSGELVWTREVEGLGIQQLWMADDGMLAGTVTPYLPGTQVGFVMSDDEVIELPDHEPMAAPALDHVAVFEVDELGTRQATGWIDLGSNSWRPATPEPVDMSATIAADRHTLEYIAIVDGAPAFVRARPGEAEMISLPVGQVGGQSVYVIARAGDYRILQHYDPDTDTMMHIRVGVASGEAVLLDPQPPQGWSFFDCYSRGIAIDGDGRLYYELRNDASASPWSYDVESDTWTQLGHHMGLVDDINVWAQSSDVMLVSANAQFQTYCPPTEWADAPEGALIGDSQQLIRSEPALELVLPNYTWQVMIDREQRCAALVGEDGWEVWALDGSNDVIDVGPGAGMWLWLD